MSDQNVAQHKNEVHLRGLLVKDPTIRYTPSGKAVANLTLLTKYEAYSEFHRIVAWEALTEKVAKLRKGDFVKVVGRLQTRSWDDKQTSQKRYVTEIVAFQISIPEEEPTKPAARSTASGKAIAEAILRPAEKNLHSGEVSTDDIPW